MVQTRHSKQTAVPDLPNGSVNGAVNGIPNGTQPLQKDEESPTHLSWWRLNDVEGRQTWEYLEDEEARKKRPQTVAEKWHLNLPTVSTFHRSSAALHCRTVELLLTRESVRRTCQSFQKPGHRSRRSTMA